MRKIYVVGGDNYYANWMEGVITKDLPSADLVLFTGGADVHPRLYGKQMHRKTWPDGWRDNKEVEEFQLAKKLGKKLIGICRGAQFLCVMAGGILVQHQYHPEVHSIRTSDGRVIIVTSSHHQRQYPYVGQNGKPAPKYKLLGWTKDLSPWSYGESKHDDMKGHLEVENALYPDIDALAIQSHPEWVYYDKQTWTKEYIQYVRDLLNTHMKANYKTKAA